MHAFTGQYKMKIAGWVQSADSKYCRLLTWFKMPTEAY